MLACEPESRGESQFLQVNFFILFLFFCLFFFGFTLTFYLVNATIGR